MWTRRPTPARLVSCDDCDQLFLDYPEDRPPPRQISAEEAHQRFPGVIPAPVALPARLLGDALEVVMELGPERRRPATDRLLERHPEFDENTIRYVIAQAKKVEQRAYQLTEPCYPPHRQVDEAEFRSLTAEALETLSGEYSDLSHELLLRAINQAQYFRSK